MKSKTKKICKTDQICRLINGRSAQITSQFQFIVNLVDNQLWNILHWTICKIFYDSFLSFGRRNLRYRHKKIFTILRFDDRRCLFNGMERMESSSDEVAVCGVEFQLSRELTLDTTIRTRENQIKMRIERVRLRQEKESKNCEARASQIISSNRLLLISSNMPRWLLTFLCNCLLFKECSLLLFHFTTKSTRVRSMNVQKGDKEIQSFAAGYETFWVFTVCLVYDFRLWTFSSAIIYIN